MAVTPIRWGIIAPGRIAHRFARAMKVVEGAELHAVASRSREKAQAFADQYGARASYGSDEALAMDPAVEAVYIASPHRFHAEQARVCLEAGKAVLIEKPLTVNAAEAEAITDLARARGLFLMEALWSRFLPVWRLVRDWLERDSVGEIRFIGSRFCFQAERDPEDRKFNHALAGGALLDLGVYNISLSEWVTRRPASAIHSMAQIGGTDVDELTAATLTYPDGVVSQFVCSFLFDAANDLTIHGTRGRIRVHPGFWQATRASLLLGDQEILAELPFRENGFEYQIEEVLRCLRRGAVESEAMPPSSSLATMRTMDAIRRQTGVHYSFERASREGGTGSPPR